MVTAATGLMNTWVSSPPPYRWFVPAPPMSLSVPHRADCLFFAQHVAQHAQHLGCCQQPGYYSKLEEIL
jgi:hypothetical protein